MGKRYLSIGALLLTLGCATRTIAQQDQTQFHVIVDLVQLNVAVTDSKGNYVTGLKPSDFQVTEDAIGEKIAFFGEGNGPTRSVGDAVPDEGKPLNASYPTREVAPAPEQTDSLSTAIAGSNVFI